MRGLLAKRQKEPIFRRKIPMDWEAFLKKSRIGQIPKKLASKLNKLELNCTNLMLNSKKTRSDCTKKPDPRVSSGLYVKNKIIRFLLDFGSSGDLLFMKKRVQLMHFCCEAGCPSLVGHFQWHLCHRQGGWHWNLVCGVLSQQEGLPSTRHCRVLPGRPSANVWPHNR